MTKIPEAVSQAWAKRSGPLVLTTVNEEGMPNAIYATCVSQYDESTVVVADNYFDKTRQNILAGSKGSVLFITTEGAAYQLKGTISYHQQGTIYDHMKQWNPAKHPGRAAAALTVEEVYSGAKRLV